MCNANLMQEHGIQGNQSFPSQLLFLGDGTGKVIAELFHSLTGVFNKTGELISKLSEVTEYEDINEVGKEVSAFGDQIDDETAEAITGGLQQFLGKML